MNSQNNIQPLLINSIVFKKIIKLIISIKRQEQIEKKDNRDKSKLERGDGEKSI